jgi:uncharacterized protein YkwD
MGRFRSPTFTPRQFGRAISSSLRLLIGIGLMCSVLSASDPTPESGNAVRELGKSEIQMWKLLNRDRSSPANVDETRGRANPLQWDEKLAEVAREHSEEMAAHGYFNHRGLDGSLPYMRVSRSGIGWLSTAENIAKFPDVTSAEAAFMNEPRFQANHRGNILKPEFTRVGIGIAQGSDGLLCITQEFVTPR